ncbi:unnamed protein product [Calypogeia fissa]
MPSSRRSKACKSGTGGHCPGKSRNAPAPLRRVASAGRLFEPGQWDDQSSERPREVVQPRVPTWCAGVRLGRPLPQCHSLTRMPAGNQLNKQGHEENVTGDSLGSDRRMFAA